MTTLSLNGNVVVVVVVAAAALASNMELVSSGSKNRRSERKPRMTVSSESGLLESSSEAVEKLPESGETVKKEVSELSSVSKYAASFWARTERVRGWWQEGQGQEEEGSFIFLPMGEKSNADSK